MRLDHGDWTEDVLGDLAQNTMGILPAPICRCATQPGGRPVRFAITFGSYGWNVRGWISPSFSGKKQWQCVQNKSQNWVSTWLKRKKQWIRKTRKNPVLWISISRVFSQTKQKFSWALICSNLLQWACLKIRDSVGYSKAHDSLTAMGSPWNWHSF